LQTQVRKHNSMSPTPLPVVAVCCCRGRVCYAPWFAAVTDGRPQLPHAAAPSLPNPCLSPVCSCDVDQVLCALVGHSLSLSTAAHMTCPLPPHPPPPHTHTHTQIHSLCQHTHALLSTQCNHCVSTPTPARRCGVQV
jgi:hypothetical protein